MMSLSIAKKYLTFLKAPFFFDLRRFQSPNPCRARQIASCASSQSSWCVFAPDMITMGLDITVSHDVMTDADKICARLRVM